MLRPIARAGGLVAVSVTTIGVGVGAVTTTLGVADAALWRDPPFRDAGRLVLLYTTVRPPAGPSETVRWSYPRIQRLRRDLHSVRDLANFTPTALNLTGTDLTEPLRGEVVSAEYFAALGVEAALGRTFGSEEDRIAGEHPIAVIGHDLWRRRYRGDSTVIGRPIGISRRSLTIIGVMPPGFRGLSNQAEVWVPTTMAPLVSYREYLTTDQNFISVVARLAPGASLETLQAELSAVVPAIARAVPSSDEDPGATIGGSAVTLGMARVPRDLRAAVWLLLGAVTLLHLLACANVTSLLMSRAVAARREAAVRASLGATAGALYRRHFGAAAALVGAGAVVGLPIAAWASRFVVPMNAWGAGNFYGSVATFSDPAFGWRTVAAWLVVTAVTVVLVGWAPAATGVPADLARHLREGAAAARATGLSLRRPGGRGVIVVVEVTLAVILLVVGTLMIDGFRRIRATPLGIVPDGVLTFELRPPEATVTAAEAPAFIERMLAAIVAVPGVVSASVDGGAPLSGSASSTLRVVGRPEPRPGEAPPVLRHYVGPDHFATLGIPLVRGRTFTDRDRAGSPRVAVISESAARRFWPAGDALGQRVWFGGGSPFDRPDSAAEIIGIVGDVKYQPLDRPPNAASFYTPYRQFSYGWRTYFVRTAGDPAAIVPAIRRAIHGVDPDVPMVGTRTLDDLLGASWSRNRFDAWFFGGFALGALVLAATGIYAVVSYAVRQRDREIAIRLAVGASPAAVFRLVVGEGIGLPMIGLLLGSAGAAGLARLFRGAVAGVPPADPALLSVAAGLLGAVAVVACGLPARRAMRIDPQEALRVD